mmetsp:Transcript_8088/g.17606  ORF Transcript_8088/g.17606 Transcript_8088/m.17606 type:complete len:203 (-) Transcript_8088:271-879(-)|eukprot:CAMPEP_0170581394 /NCGR_PEP_ID=MMETSP0224-20130122/7013_1 /TAXON_ID=285029 /ORGANISM="Togula jolla, Strain CCCM 725" /LENGTH=202 /DNA_ID=CAMNT_0010904521 /DNA_START=44 /DNA_END=652 /DNA_ORIENTATION=+
MILNVCCCAPVHLDEEGVQCHPVETDSGLNEIQDKKAIMQMANSTLPQFPKSSGRPNQGQPSPYHTPTSRPLDKAKLQDIVRDFSKAAVNGMQLMTVDADTSDLSEVHFVMDKYLYVLTLAMPGGEEVHLNMKDMRAIYRGHDVSTKAPKLAHLAAVVVGVEFREPLDQRYFFYFKDVAERDRFYTCLKILRMSVDITNANK